MASERVLVLGARPYDFKDRDSGREVKGLSVHYITDAPEDGVVGHVPVKVSLPQGAERDLKNVPGIYDIDFRMAGKNMRAVALRFVDTVSWTVKEELAAVPAK